MTSPWASLQPCLGSLSGTGVGFKRPLDDEGAAHLPLLLPARTEGADGQRHIQRSREVREVKLPHVHSYLRNCAFYSVCAQICHHAPVCLILVENSISQRRVDHEQTSLRHSMHSGFVSRRHLLGTPLSVCVCVSVRYAPSQRWHIDTILHVLTTVNTARATQPAAFTWVPPSQLNFGLLHHHSAVFTAHRKVFVLNTTSHAKFSEHILHMRP